MIRYVLYSTYVSNMSRERERERDHMNEGRCTLVIIACSCVNPIKGLLWMVWGKCYCLLWKVVIMSNKKQEEIKVCITMCISRVDFMRVGYLYFL